MRLTQTTASDVASYGLGAGIWTAVNLILSLAFGGYDAVVTAVNQTKYGLSRTIRVVLDLITVKYMLDYFASPMKLFGRVGLSCFAVALAPSARNRPEVLCQSGTSALKWSTRPQLPSLPLFDGNSAPASCSVPVRLPPGRLLSIE